MSHVFAAGSWTEAPSNADVFHAWNPATGSPLDGEHPVSPWPQLDEMAAAGAEAAMAAAGTPPNAFGDLLDAFAARLDARRVEIASAAHLETGLPLEPRLMQIEFDRMLTQLRQAATAARDTGPDSWREPRIDSESGIQSDRGPLGGPVLTIGPNNFPLAFHGVSGGDAAAALAAGNPIIAKGHPLHPATGRLLAECAAEAVRDAGVHPATIQFFHHCTPEDGLRLVADPRVAAVGFTGSRSAGLAIKAAADASGTPAFLEMSSLNPVFVLPGALRDGATELAEAWAGSVTLGGGQFCTKPGLLIVIGDDGGAMVDAAVDVLAAAAPGILFSRAGVEALQAGISAVEAAGGRKRCGGGAAEPGFRHQATLLEVDGTTMLERFDDLARELFGPAALVVRARDLSEAASIAARLDGQLTATIHTGTGDHEGWTTLAAHLRPRCGRLLENKMPTGVAVVPSMVHGGPYPATGHPGFTAVGMPTSVNRFSMARCWDGVAEDHRPEWLR